MKVFSTKFKLVYAIVWTLIIFIGCSLPGKDLPKLSLFQHTDKLVHFIFFAIFTYLWIWVKPYKKPIILAFAIAYGILLECYQLLFVKGRSFDFWDIVADSIGAIIVYLCIIKTTKTTH
jgi:VanZ family protein